jgi:acetyl esterase/lipase
MAGKAMMSEAAARFLREATPSDNPDLSTADMTKVRADIRAGFEPAALRALERHRVTTRPVEVGGVPCLELTPEEGGTKRTVLYCYGGGYVTGSPFEDLPVSAALADHLDARIIAVDYRLAPEHPFPAAVEDGRAVYRHVSKTCAPGTWALAGESAGGNLALGLLQWAYVEGLDLPAGLAMCSPWCDLENGGDSIDFNAGRDPTLDRDFLRHAAAVYAADAALDDPGVSPINGVLASDMPAAFITTGTRDLLMSQCIRLHRLMCDAGMDADLRVWDGLWHVFEFYDELPEAAASLREIAEFLDNCLNKS